MFAASGLHQDPLAAVCLARILPFLNYPCLVIPLTSTLPHTVVTRPSLTSQVSSSLDTTVVGEATGEAAGRGASRCMDLATPSERLVRVLF